MKISDNESNSHKRKNQSIAERINWGSIGWITNSPRHVTGPLGQRDGYTDV
jgi:hypothetical protein